MDLPKNNQTMTLRRHNTSPSSSAGRSVIASVSVGRRITAQSFLPGRSASMKSNPYVGTFRHSPPTSSSHLQSLNKMALWRTSNNQNCHHWCTVPVSLKACKNSAHIGFFRHAPPSCLDHTTMSSTTSKEEQEQVVSNEQQELLVTLLQELNPALLQMDDNRLRKNIKIMVSGRLPGGGQDYLERTRSYRKDFRESSAEGTLSTVNTLSNLAAWFLFPLAHDAESCGYRQQDEDPPQTFGKRKRHKKRSKEEGLLSQLSPYLPTFLESEPSSRRDSPKMEKGKSFGRRETPPRKDEEDKDDSSSSDSDSEGPSNPTISTMDASTMSVSSLAEAYFAHQNTAKDNMSPMSQHDLLSPGLPTASVLDPSSVAPSHHQLDYVITQMDIARMSRNASRHLDVQSILGLPVITYHQRGPPAIVSPRKQPNDSQRHTAGWSWTIVEETEGQTEFSAEAEIPDEKTDFCVICLEHFVQGDRLRVLPCDHSFHVGCIDRWLSGSQSFQECYTGGCPTCKKQPAKGNMGRPTRSQSLCESPSYNVRDGKDRSASLDGSVPSFAFAQLGSVLFAQQEEQQGGASICSGFSGSS